jgi:GNAT superfamily N-acetyltransferase
VNRLLESRVETVKTDAGVAEARQLFREYAAWLNVDLSFQDFERELSHLPGDYTAPSGTLLLCVVGSAVAGCAAVRQWSPDSAELKRMFVREQYRGHGCGLLLAQHALAFARTAGYRRILLDTLAFMTDALHLYRRLGFRETAAYRFNPLAGATFMELTFGHEP